MLTAERLRELLDYDPETGEFRWRAGADLGGSGRSKRQPGAIAGGDDGRYRSIGIDGGSYLSHRLAWLYVHGVWPERLIDHIDGNGRNNALANLRSTTDAVNTQNLRSAKKRRIEAPLGVGYQARGRRKWFAQITANGVLRYLGSYATPEEAHEAYLTAKRSLHEGCTI